MTSTLIRPESFKTSVWSGGKTRQIVIFPQDADYQKRDFLWRFSSATVDDERSSFTALGDFSRFISPVRGGMTLFHDGGAGIAIPLFAVHPFDGAARTECLGRCNDVNLMVRKGAASGGMRSLRLTKRPARLALQDADHAVLYCAKGRAKLTGAVTQILKKGDALYISEPGPGLYVSGQSRAVLFAASVKIL